MYHESAVAVLEFVSIAGPIKSSEKKLLKNKNNNKKKRNRHNLTDGHEAVLNNEQQAKVGQNGQ